MAAPPLVSCIMPTRGRPEFALQAARLFAAQDYPARELVVVIDPRDAAHERLAAEPGVRIVHAPAGASLGGRRNSGCAAALGGLLIQWDDDDWYAPDRLSVQLQPLLDGRSDITAFADTTFFDLRGWRFWRCAPALNRRLFDRNEVHSGTLAFRRGVWERHARYPPTSLGEDAGFLARAVRNGARLRALPADEHFLYVRHDGNTWDVTPGGDEWREVPEPPLPAPDRAFYEAWRAARRARPAGPLVSCIMPTRDRREWVRRSLALYARQDYRARELVVVDDGSDAVGDLVRAIVPGARYIRLRDRRSVGEKRNLACRAARGSVVAHWDDDDWYAPHRLSYQVAELGRSGAAACGLRRSVHVEVPSGRVWSHSFPRGPQLTGSSLCYRRDVWERQRFDDVDAGEDTRWLAALGRPVLALADRTIVVATIHAHNTTTRRRSGIRWRAEDPALARRILGDDLEAWLVEPS
jgi:glycosyltransferase involved in cell wall biosynthesis